MDKLYEYLISHYATDFAVRVTKREDGKPLVATIHPAGVVGDPLEFKLTPHEDEKPSK